MHTKRTESLEAYFNDPHWVKKLYKTLDISLREREGVFNYQKRQERYFAVITALSIFLSILISGTGIVLLSLHAGAILVVVMSSLAIAALVVGWTLVLFKRYTTLKEWFLPLDDIYIPIEGKWAIPHLHNRYLTKLYDGKAITHSLDSWPFESMKVLCFEEQPGICLIVTMISKSKQGRAPNQIDFNWFIANRNNVYLF